MKSDKTNGKSKTAPAIVTDAIGFEHPTITESDVIEAGKQYRAISDNKKRRMLAALAASLGIVYTAAKIAGISRDSHYQWLKDDAEYKKAVRDIDNISVDFTESKLFQKIREGDTTAIIFHLKTKGKKRGYVERVQFGFSPNDGNDDDEIESTLDI